MPNVHRLGKGAVRKINNAIDAIFDKAKVRMLGHDAVRGKRIMIGFQRDLSLPGIYEAGSLEEGVKPDLDVLQSLLDVAANYIEAARVRAKARVINEVEAAIANARHKGGMAREDFRDKVNVQLAEVWRDVSANIHAIVDVEAQRVKNTSILDGIIGANAAAGIKDPYIYFVVVRDKDLCGECKRLHLMPDGVTPRVWKLSELGHAYHKKGEEEPKVGGLHPHCRCTMVTLMPGYGFNKQGKVTFKAYKHDELKAQRED
jgi:hypothetical protein